LILLFWSGVIDRVERGGSWLVVLVILSLSSTGGCSWIFVQPLRSDYDPRDYPNCTSSRTAPVFDTLFTLTNVASAVYVAGENNVTNKGAAVTAGALVATLWALSAGYGYIHTAECEDAQTERGRGYYAPPHLGARPQFYPQPVPPPRTAPAAPAPYDSPAAAPQLPASSGPPRPQLEDNDEPRTTPVEEIPATPGPERTPPKAPRGVPERLDAPRSGG
jgi:hypothetical protein